MTDTPKFHSIAHPDGSASLIRADRCPVCHGADTGKRVVHYLDGTAPPPKLPIPTRVALAILRAVAVSLQGTGRAVHSLGTEITGRHWRLLLKASARARMAREG
jgi:hypothetical protein